MASEKRWYYCLDFVHGPDISMPVPSFRVWKVTFVEVSAQFLTSDCFVSSEFTTVDHQGKKVTFEWVPLEETTEVSLTRPYM